MQKIPFVRETRSGESIFLNGEECINWYPKIIQTAEGKEIALVGTPGLTEAYDSGLSLKCRGMIVTNDAMYSVIGGRVVYTDSNENFSLLSGALIGGNKQVSMAYNGNEILVVNGVDTEGYLINTSTNVVSQISDTDFPGGDLCTEVDGYFLVNKPNTNQFFRSDFQDGSSWQALNFSSKGGKPDNIKTIFSDHRDVFLLGDTGEIFYNNGAATFNFARREGAFFEIGILAPHSINSINNAVYWLGQNKDGAFQVMQVTGLQPTDISTPELQYKIQQKVNPEDAVSITYTERGHAFYCLIFPNDEAEVYDSTTGLWHTRRSRVTIDGRLVDGRWRVNAHAFFNKKHFVGDYTNGKIYEMSNDVYDENGEELIAELTGIALRQNQADITINEVQAVFEPGVGLVSGQGSDPVAYLGFSTDGGHTYSNEYDAKLGKLGETFNRAIWWLMHQGENWRLKIKISDPVKRILKELLANIDLDGD